MSNEVIWALGRGNGIVALAFLTLAVALGIATRSSRPLIGLPRFAIAEVHRFIALAATLLVLLHVGLLFMDPYAKLELIDFVLPFRAAYRPFWQGLGTVGFCMLLVVVTTSLFRHRLGLRVFRAVHASTYLAWPIAMAHAVGNGTDAAQVWFMVFAGVCALAVAAAVAWRLHPKFTEFADP